MREHKEHGEGRLSSSGTGPATVREGEGHTGRHLETLRAGRAEARTTGQGEEGEEEDMGKGQEGQRREAL